MKDRNHMTADYVDDYMEGEVIFNQQNLGIGAPYLPRARRVDYPLAEYNYAQARAERQMYQLVKKSEQILFSAQTVFPFDFFPDTLTINGNKIDIVNSSFFASHQTTSIPLRDIANVEVQTSPFFASLKIINIRYPMHPHQLQYLKKKDAIRAKKIIDGLLVAMSQGTDISQIEPDKLIDQIEKVGASAVVE